MSTQSQGTLNNNKSVFKGGNRDVSAANNIENQGISPAQINNSFTTFKGPKQLQVSAGTSEIFNARSMQIDDDNETFVVKYPLEADAVAGNGAIFIAEHDYVIDSVRARWGVASTSLTATLYKANSGTALSSGTAISSAIDTSTAANTNASATLISESARIVNRNQTVGLVFSGTTTGLVGLVVTIKARRIIPGTRSQNYLE
jgi:hypothetical protein